MIILILLVIAIFIGVFVLIINKIKIDVSSFFKPTLPLARGIFGVYCFTGKQGTGKTYALNKYVRKHCSDSEKAGKVYSNITLEAYRYHKLKNLDHLLSLVNEWDCVIIFDEVLSLLDKDSSLDKLSKKRLGKFLRQMRKHHNIFLTTAQEWLELDIKYRRYVRIQIECSTRPLGKLGGILTEVYYDTTAIKWDQLENEYVSPLISTKICKYEKIYMETYDTEELVDDLS